MRKIVAAILLCAVCANADLIEADWRTVGDSLLTQDTATGLYWLDVTESTGRNYDQILLEISAGGPFSEFRLATVDEMKTLFTNAGITDFGFPLASNLVPARELLRLVGVTEDNGPGAWQTIAWTGTRSTSGVVTVADVVVKWRSWESRYVAYGGFSGARPWESGPNLGAWLVSTSITPVPEPSTLTLLGLGALGLLWIRRRR